VAADQLVLATPQRRPQQTNQADRQQRQASRFRNLLTIVRPPFRGQMKLDAITDVTEQLIVHRRIELELKLERHGRISLQAKRRRTRTVVDEKVD
jgi:hypothetical protein